MITCVVCGPVYSCPHDNRDLTGEVLALREQLSCVQAEHSLDKAALDDLREQLMIRDVNALAMRRENEELLIKLQSAERSLSRVTAERDEAREAHAALIKNYSDVMDERNAAIVQRDELRSRRG